MHVVRLTGKAVAGAAAGAAGALSDVAGGLADATLGTTSEVFSEVSRTGVEFFGSLNSSFSKKPKEAKARAANFQKLFDLYPHETLIAEYGCSMHNTSVPYSGRLYLFQEHAGFKSALFGKRTVISFSWGEARTIEKTTNALYIPNAIMVEMFAGEKLFFTGFIGNRRDEVFEHMHELWQGATSAPQELHLDSLRTFEQYIADQEEEDEDSDEEERTESIVAWRKSVSEDAQGSGDSRNRDARRDEKKNLGRHLSASSKASTVSAGLGYAVQVNPPTPKTGEIELSERRRCSEENLSAVDDPRPLDKPRRSLDFSTTRPRADSDALRPRGREHDRRRTSSTSRTSPSASPAAAAESDGSPGSDPESSRRRKPTRSPVLSPPNLPPGRRSRRRSPAAVSKSRWDRATPSSDTELDPLLSSRSEQRRDSRQSDADATKELRKEGSSDTEASRSSRKPARADHTPEVKPRGRRRGPPPTSDVFSDTDTDPSPSPAPRGSLVQIPVAPADQSSSSTHIVRPMPQRKSADDFVVGSRDGGTSNHGTSHGRSGVQTSTKSSPSASPPSQYRIPPGEPTGDWNEVASPTRSNATSTRGRPARSSPLSSPQGVDRSSVSPFNDDGSVSSKSRQRVSPMLLDGPTEADKSMMIETLGAFRPNDPEPRLHLGVPTRAAIITRCLLYWVHIHQFPVKMMVIRLCTAIGDAVKTRPFDHAVCCFWLSTTTALLGLLRQNRKRLTRLDAASAMFEKGSGSSGSSRYSSSRWAQGRPSEGEDSLYITISTQFTSTIWRVHEALIHGLLSVLKALTWPAFFDCDSRDSAVLSIPSMGALGRLRSGGAKLVTEVLDIVLSACLEDGLAPSLVRQVLAELVTLMDRMLVGELLVTPDLCNIATALNLKLSVSEVEQWASANHAHVSPDIMRLVRTREAADVLIVNQDILRDQGMRETICPHLDLADVRALISNMSSDELVDKVPASIARVSALQSGQDDSDQDSETNDQLSRTTSLQHDFVYEVEPLTMSCIDDETPLIVLDNVPVPTHFSSIPAFDFLFPAPPI